MQHARPNRLRRAVAYAALAALLGVITLVLSQCTMVGDNVTGVGLDRSGRGLCKQDCQNTHQKCLTDAAIFCECDLQTTCKQGNTCFSLREAACDAALAECNKNCNHHQGAGIVG